MVSNPFEQILVKWDHVSRKGETIDIFQVSPPNSTPAKTDGWNLTIGGLGRCFSFSTRAFSGSMLVFGGVAIGFHKNSTLPMLSEFIMPHQTRSPLPEGRQYPSTKKKTWVKTNAVKYIIFHRSYC